MHSYATLYEDYFPLRVGIRYQFIKESYDHVVLKCGGHNYCVPKSFVQGYESWVVDAVKKASQSSKPQNSRNQSSRAKIKKSTQRPRD